MPACSRRWPPTASISALGSGPGLAFIVKGSPVKGIAAMADPPLLFALVVRNDDTDQDRRRSQGPQGRRLHRRLGDRAGSSARSSRQQGWGYDGIAQVPIGDDANRIAALKTKSIDGAIVNLAVALNFVQRGDGRILLRFGDLREGLPHPRDLRDRQGDRRQARRRCAASSRAGSRPSPSCARTRRETVAIAKEVMGTDEPTTSGIYDELMPMFSDTGRFEPKALAVLSKLVRRDEDAAGRARHDASSITEAFLPNDAEGNRSAMRRRPYARTSERRSSLRGSEPQLGRSRRRAIRQDVSHQFGEGRARHVRALPTPRSTSRAASCSA